MLSKRIFDADFKTVLEEELRRKGMSIKELAEKAGIPAATIYKITSGERDPRFSTVRRIVNVLEPKKENFIAVIGAKFLLDDLKATGVDINGEEYGIREYPVNSIDECIISGARAEKEGASGIICAPIVASTVEKIVDVPVVIVRPREDILREAIETVSKKIGGR